GTGYGVNAVHLSIAAMAAIGIALTFLYRSPPREVAAAASARLDIRTMMAVIVAALIWGLFNVAFAVTFSFGPIMLVERGWTIAQAGSVISIGLWLGVLSVPMGGLLADRLKAPQAVLVVGSLIFAGLMLCFAHTGAVLFSVIAIGLIGGQPAGPMMSLPARVLSPATRAIGMGIFYTIYYGTMMIGPIIGGAAAKWQGSATAAFDFGALVLLVCPLLLVGYNAIAAARLRLSAGGLRSRLVASGNRVCVKPAAANRQTSRTESGDERHGTAAHPARQSGCHRPYQPAAGHHQPSRQQQRLLQDVVPVDRRRPAQPCGRRAYPGPRDDRVGTGRGVRVHRY